MDRHPRLEQVPVAWAPSDLSSGTPTEYGGVWLLWQDSDQPQWPAQDEIDFPEGDFQGQMNAYIHYANPKGGQDVISTSSRWSWLD